MSYGFDLLVVQDGQTPVCFRYVIEPLESHVTNVFKPNLSSGEDEAQPNSFRHSTLGGTYIGNMSRVISNKRAGVVWEAHSCVFASGFTDI